MSVCLDVCLSLFVSVRRDAAISHSQIRSVLSSRCTALSSQYHKVQLQLTPVYMQAAQCVLWCWLDSSGNGQTTSAQGGLNDAHRYRHYSLLQISTKTCPNMSDLKHLGGGNLLKRNEYK